MTAKQFLAQAYNLDRRIKSKVEQIASLNELAAKITTTLTGLPKGPNSDSSTMASTVAKIVDLQAEIDRDIEGLVDLKRDIVNAIKAIRNPEWQTLLELRYLCFKSWEQIAIDMGYSMRQVYRMHDERFLKMSLNVTRCHAT